MSKSVLGIYGTGGVAREIYEFLPELPDADWKEVVFIDDTKEAGSISGAQCMPFSAFASRYSCDAAEIIISLGEPKYREALYNKAASHHYTFASIIHPKALVDKRAVIGQGVLIKAGTIVSNAEIGDNSMILSMAVVGHDVKIGKHCVISSHCTVNGGSVLEDNVYMGVSSNVRESVKVGKSSIVSMTAAVFKDVEAEKIVMGNPARVIAQNSKKLVFNKSIVLSEVKS